MVSSVRFGETTVKGTTTNFYDDDTSDLAIYDHFMHNVSCLPLPAQPPPIPIPLAHDLLDPTADIMAANSASAGLSTALTPGVVMPNNPAASMASAVMSEDERKVVSEFCHLLEKSKQLFNGLRDLPQYGHKQWQAYFGRTFDIYTKLWKFQQQHRAILDARYGLKRWQIGEIASKIGQLYYHY